MELIINNIFELFSSIIHFLFKQSVYTSILFIIIFITTLFLKKKSPHWSYGLWLLILVRLLLPTDLSFSASARNLFDKLPIADKITDSIEEITSKGDNNRIQANIEGANNDAFPIKGNNLTSAEPINFITYKLVSWQVLITIVWITGCLLMIIVVIKKLLQFHHIIKDSSFIQDDKLTAFLMDCQNRLKIRRAVRIISSDEFLSPFTVGLFKPIIYFPSSLLNSADTDTIHSIIAHELVHIKHCDALWIKLQNILQIIYCLNPVVWYTNRQISLAREQICDSAVLTEGIILPKTYGNSIIQILKSNLFGLDLAELLPCFGSHKKIYKQRIQNIIKDNAMKKQKALFVFLVICLIGIFVLPLANNTKAAQELKNTVNDEIKFIIPIKGHVTSLFGWRKSPFSGEREFHEGMDIAAPAGTPVVASAPGVVIFAGWGGGYGRIVKIQHNNGYSTVYAQCEKLLVKEGQSVKQGDTIASCGMTGSATGNHTHFEIRKDGKAVNPYPFLRKNDKGQILNEKKTNNNEINFIIPLEANLGHITALFGWRRSPFRFGRDFHTGIDIAATKGTPIFAAASGVVKKAGWGDDNGNGGYGWTVVLEHSNGYSTVYAHCDTMSIKVKEGHTVKSGDTIANSGQSGAATGPHLHFEIRKDGEQLNPTIYISSVPVSSEAIENKLY